jgi:murein DD-endopeptidase MepM/ murein hydrolase activator NlpD
MAAIVHWLRSPLQCAAALALMATGLAACSGDTSRFNDNPFSSGPEATGSIQPGSAAPANRVESRPLPQVSSSPAAAGASSGVAGGGRGMASYAPNTSPAQPGTLEVTGAIATPKPAASGSWTWEGGTPISVAHGDTVESIARRYGVPASAIIQANNLTSPATLRAGQQLVIPRYRSARAPASSPSIAPAAAAAAAPSKAVHVVAAGETLIKISRMYRKPVSVLARANNIPMSARLKIGDRLVIPGVRTSAVKADPAPAGTVADASPTPSVPSSQTEAAPSASVFSQVPETPAATQTSSALAGGGTLPKFRWPANGRVIMAFGPSTNGQQNDGINIAVPENTPVKAAEDGVVAYAGNELKGYGNLVLVRHSNGYVTAYAHAKELLVKRGDQVKRGQIIARSGQSGNVTAPQLHFEIRKGAAPVDPTKFLNGA